MPTFSSCGNSCHSLVGWKCFKALSTSSVDIQSIWLGAGFAPFSTPVSSSSVFFGASVISLVTFASKLKSFILFRTRRGPDGLWEERRLGDVVEVEERFGGVFDEKGFVVEVRFSGDRCRDLIGPRERAELGVSSGEVLSLYLPRPPVGGGVPLQGDFDLLRLFFFSGVEGSFPVLSVDRVGVLFFLSFFFLVEFVVDASVFVFLSDFGMVL